MARDPGPSRRPRRVVTGGLLLPDDDGGGRPADIVINGDTIEAVSPPLAAVPEDCDVVEASGMLVIPGLVNAHTHGHGGLAKGVGDRWTLELLLNAGGWIGGGWTNDDRYLSTLLAAIEMLKKGCTACFDMSPAVPLPSSDGVGAAAQAYVDAGMRAVVAPMIGDIHFYRAVPGLAEAAPENLRHQMERCVSTEGGSILEAIRSIAAEWHFPTDQVRLGVGPTIPLHCTDFFLKGCHRLACDFGLPLQTHLAESRGQAVAALGRYGRSITLHLAGLGVIDERFSGAHAIWLDADDIVALAEHGGAITHNPGSNLKLGSGIADVRAFLDKGVAVGIGTDGGASSDGQNMFEAMRLAGNLSRIQGRPPDRWLSAAEAMGLATAGSAKVLGMQDRIGCIAPGYKADLTFLDLRHINYVPLNVPLNQVVHVEDGNAVKRVMVGGDIVVEDGEVRTIDLDKVIRLAGEAAERLRAASGDTREWSERLAPFVGMFCHGLGCGAWTGTGHPDHRLASPD